MSARGSAIKRGVVPWFGLCSWLGMVIGVLIEQAARAMGASGNSATAELQGESAALLSADSPPAGAAVVTDLPQQLLQAQNGGKCRSVQNVCELDQG